MFIIFWFLFSRWILTAVEKREFLINLVILGLFKCNIKIFYIWCNISWCLGLSGQTILVLVKTRNEKPSSCSAVGTTCRNMALLVCLLRKNWPTGMWRWTERFFPYHFTMLIWTGEKQKSVQSSWHRSHGMHSTPPFSTGGNVAHWALSMGRRCLKSIWGGRRKGDTLSFLL